MATKPRVVDPGIVQVHRRDNNEIVASTVHVISRKEDVIEGDDSWHITGSDGSKHWYPKDALLGVIVMKETEPDGNA